MLSTTPFGASYSTLKLALSAQGNVFPPSAGKKNLTASTSALHFGYILPDSAEPDSQFLSSEPASPDRARSAANTKKLLIARWLLGGIMPQALQSKIQNATFPVYEDQDELVQVGSKTALRGYHLTPRKALQNVDLARNPLFFEVTSQVGNGEIPVAYIPPEDAQKPVILLSPGAAGRIADYVPFIQAVTDNGYGVMAYQYALLDEAGKHISQQGFSFKQIEARLSDDLETLSDVLAGQRPLKPDGRHQPVWLDVPYNRQVLAGHSTGGFLSANLLAYDPHVGKPERPYRALVLLATPPTFEVAFKNVLGRSQLGDKQLQKAEKPRTLSLVRNAFNLDGFAPFDVTPSLSGVSQEIPTLFIQGQKDDLVRDTIWKRCQDHRDGFYSVDYFCLPGANHSNLLGGDYGQQVAKQLDAFLEESLERSRGYGWSA